MLSGAGYAYLLPDDLQRYSTPSISVPSHGCLLRANRRHRAPLPAAPSRTTLKCNARSTRGGRMNIRKLQQGLKYRGRVTAVRQTYHVFEAKEYFFVLSFARSKARKGSGYFNVVDQAAVQY